MKPILTLLFCILTLLIYGQESKSPKFDIQDFNQKSKVARWLCTYDLVAWWTTDSAMAQDKKEVERLGKEWFCYQDRSDTWHAVYGKYADNSFTMVFHFTVDSNSKVKRVYEKVDTAMANVYSRALMKAYEKVKYLREKTKVRFNQCIKQNDDKTFTVWILPAFQLDRTAVYGGEFIYTIDPSGNKVLKDDSYFPGDFRGFKVDKPREIWLNYRDSDKPTLGAVFFVWYYKEYFTNIYIDCAKSKSTLFKNGENDYSWIHAEKDPDKKGKD